MSGWFSNKFRRSRIDMPTTDGVEMIDFGVRPGEADGVGGENNDFAAPAAQPQTGPGRLVGIRNKIKEQLNRGQKFVVNKGASYYSALGKTGLNNIDDDTLAPIMVTVLIAMVVCDGILLGDLSKQNRSVHLGIHISRIVLLVGVAITAAIAWIQGTGYTSINPWAYVIVKLVAFAVSLAYTIIVGVQFSDPNNKSPLEIARLALSTISTGISLILAIYGLLYLSEKLTSVSFLSVILYCVLGISLSGVALAILPTDTTIVSTPLPTTPSTPSSASPPPSDKETPGVFIPKPNKPVEQKIDRTKKVPPPPRPVSPVSSGSTKITRPQRPTTP